MKQRKMMQWPGSRSVDIRKGSSLLLSKEKPICQDAMCIDFIRLKLVEIYVFGSVMQVLVDCGAVPGIVAAGVCYEYHPHPPIINKRMRMDDQS